MRKYLTVLLNFVIKFILPKIIFKNIFEVVPSSRSSLVRFSRIVSGVIYWPLKICKGTAVLERELYLNNLFIDESSRKILTKRIDLSSINSLKIGLIGNLSGTSMTPISFLDFFASSNHKLYIYDVSDGDALAKKSKYHYSYSYLPGKDKWKNLEEICDIVNRDELDLVVIADTMVFSSCVASRVDAKAIYYYSFGSGVLPKISKLTNILCQPQVDFQTRENRLYSYNSMQNLQAARTILVAGYYDRRGIVIDPLNDSTKDIKYVFYHGSIYKILNYSFLKNVSQILSSQSDLKFIYVGHSTISEQLRIKLYLLFLGIYRKCLYLPHNVYGQGDFGVLGEVLGNSLVFLNPWPVGAGAARFEAYAYRIPVAHLDLSVQHKLKKSKLNTVVDVLGFKTELNTNTSKVDYVDFVIKSINDLSFRKKVVEQQCKKVEYLSSSTRWWNQVIEDYINQFKS
jgi:hypothetical protein